MPLSSIEQLLKDRMGLHSATVGSSTVSQAVEQRMRECGIDEPGAYLQILRHSSTEMDALIDTVVIPETWFFRDRNPFDAFRHWVETEWLPHNALRPLRVLSVPCSSGEEPYTLAMCLADAGLPVGAGHIDAVDIGSTNIEKALAAVYGANSFRGNDLSFRERYFRPDGNRFELNNEIRQRVSFAQANILDASFSVGRQPYHVIFCRNLLIYFDRPTQDRAITSLEGLLEKDGLLFLGHSETSLLLDRSYTPLDHSRSFGFRQVSGKTDSNTPSRPRRQNTTTPRRRPDVREYREPAPFSGVAPTTGPTTETVTPVDETLLEKAMELADQGHLDEAAQHCETLLTKQVFQAHTYYLLGVIRQAAGNLKEAEQLYRKSIYLEPDHYRALSQLSGLLTKKGDHTGAQRIADRASRAHSRGQPQEADS